jgi:hypothetical protein
MAIRFTQQLLRLDESYSGFPFEAHASVEYT